MERLFYTSPNLQEYWYKFHADWLKPKESIVLYVWLIVSKAYSHY